MVRQFLDESAPTVRSKLRIRWNIGLSISLLVLPLTQPSPAADTGPTGSQKIAFARDIRPILADKCFQCHGPDATQRKGKLRLDNRRDAMAPASSGSPAIVPGKLDESELYARITSDDPERTDAPGQDREAASLRPRSGGSRPGSSRGPSIRITGRSCRRSVPRFHRSRIRAGAATRSIAFILARLEAEGLSPSPEADRITLIRRLSLDLIGLPPIDRGGRRVRGRHPRRRLLPAWWTGSWIRRNTASDGDASGSMPRVMPTPTATRKTSPGRSSPIATGSSRP